MTATSTAEDRLALRETARRFLERQRGDDREVWDGLVDLGLPGLAVPEGEGGGGGTFADLAVVLGELGRLLVPGPFFATTVLAAGALSLAGDAGQRSRWLTPLATGAATGTLATCGRAGRIGPDGLGITAHETAGGALVLAGTASFVPDATTAGLVVIAGRSAGGRVRLVVVEQGTPGLSTIETPTFDLTRRIGEVVCEEMMVGADAVLGGGAGGAVFDRLLDRAAIALAVESAAGIQRLLELSTTYARERHQFGRPIGTFQAIKHRCADMAVRAASAAAAADHAVGCVDDKSQLAGPASVAKSFAADAYAAVAGDAIQLHGGTGYTWEHEAHRHLRRAKLNQALFGDSGWHRERLARVALEQRQVSRGAPHADR